MADARHLDGSFPRTRDFASGHGRKLEIDDKRFGATQSSLKKVSRPGQMSEMIGASRIAYRTVRMFSLLLLRVMVAWIYDHAVNLPPRWRLVGLIRVQVEIAALTRHYLLAYFDGVWLADAECDTRDDWSKDYERLWVETV